MATPTAAHAPRVGHDPFTTVHRCTGVRAARWSGGGGAGTTSAGGVGALRLPPTVHAGLQLLDTLRAEGVTLGARTRRRASLDVGDTALAGALEAEPLERLLALRW